MEAVLRGRGFGKLQHDGRHVWPQALLLGLSGRLHLPEGPERVRVLDAIGVLENADADFALLRHTMTHDPTKKNFRDEAYHNVTRSRGKHQQTEHARPTPRSTNVSGARNTVGRTIWARDPTANGRRFSRFSSRAQHNFI